MFKRQAFSERVTHVPGGSLATIQKADGTTQTWFLASRWEDRGADYLAAEGISHTEAVQLHQENLQLLEDDLRFDAELSAAIEESYQA